jgi:hypothetical protein
MEEEWMRDRALLRDLLEETPHASPQALAQAIGRSVSWVKKWRKRILEGTSDDPCLLCSRSRAHHAPYFRWDGRVSQKIVEMRFAPPENLKRVPGPRALLYYLPRDPELQAAQIPLPRSSRTKWRDPARHGLPGNTFQRVAPFQRAARAIGRDPDGCRKMVVLFRLNKARKASESRVIEVCNFVDAGTSIALSAQAREDFHESFRVGNGDHFLAPLWMSASDDL